MIRILQKRQFHSKQLSLRTGRAVLRLHRIFTGLIYKMKGFWGKWTQIDLEQKTNNTII